MTGSILQGGIRPRVSWRSEVYPDISSISGGSCQARGDSALFAPQEVFWLYLQPYLQLF